MEGVRGSSTRERQKGRSTTPRELVERKQCEMSYNPMSWNHMIGILSLFLLDVQVSLTSSSCSTSSSCPQTGPRTAKMTMRVFLGFVGVLVLLPCFAVQPTPVSPGLRGTANAAKAILAILF